MIAVAEEQTLASHRFIADGCGNEATGLHDHAYSWKGLPNSKGPKRAVVQADRHLFRASRRPRVMSWEGTVPTLQLMLAPSVAGAPSPNRLQNL